MVLKCQYKQTSLYNIVKIQFQNGKSWLSSKYKHMLKILFNSLFNERNGSKNILKSMCRQFNKKILGQDYWVRFKTG